MTGGDMKHLHLSCILVFVLVSLAMASWVDLPLENRLAEADLVVVGTITSVDNSTHKEIDVGTIKVQTVLKGDGNISEVMLAWPSKRRGFMTTADIIYKKGDSGIWILQKGEKANRNFPQYYFARYPKDHQPAGRVEAVRALLESGKSGKWVSCRIRRYERTKPGELHSGTVRSLVYEIDNTSHIYACRKKDSKIESEKAVELGEKTAKRFWLWVEARGLLEMKTATPKRSETPPPTMEISLKIGDKTNRLVTHIPVKDDGMKSFFRFIDDIAAMCLSADNAAEEKFLEAHPMPGEKKPGTEKKPQKKSDGPECPKCESGDIIPIIWGMPSREDSKLAKEGKVMLGGCIPPEKKPWPKQHCRKCGHQW